MTAADNTRNDFAVRFNRLMAQHGKSTPNTSDADFAKTAPSTRDVIKAMQNRPTKTSSTSSSSSKSSTEITDAQRESYLAARGKEMKSEDNNRPWYKDVANAGLNVLSTLDVPAAYGRSALKEGMDAFETSSVGKWTYNKMGYDPSEDGRELSKGSWKDFTSQAERHMGFGEIWADARGDDKNKWLDRGVGLAGDIALDPLTYVGAGLITKTGGKVAEQTAARFGVEAGKTASKATGKEAVKITGKNAANNVADTLKGADEVFNKAASERAALFKYTRKNAAHPVSRALAGGHITESEAIARLKIGTTAKDYDALITGPTGRNVIEEATEAQIGKTVYEVRKRSQKGRLVGNPKEIVTNVANHVTEAAKRVILKPLDDATKRFKNGISTSKPLSVNELNDLKSNTPYFPEWHAKVTDILKATPNPTPNQIDNAYAKADEVVTELLRPESDRIFALAKGSMEDSLERIPTLKMFGKQVMEMPTLGKVGSGVSKMVVASPVGENLQKMFSYTSNFPGYSSLIAQKSRALGVARYEARRKEIIEVAKDFSRKEARQLQRNLENGIRGTGEMARAYDFLRQSYDDLMGEEVAAGVRDAAKSAKANDYAYTHIYRKRKTAKTIEAWNKSRSEAVATTGRLTNRTTDDAISAGFKVEQDAFKNLLMRQMRANRKLTDAYFYRDLVSHYGIKGKINKKEMKGERQLVGVPKKKNNDILAAMQTNLEPGEGLFIDADIARIYQNYQNISKNPDEIIRGLDYITRKFKIMNTIYFPGYHVRNMIGDYFMGLMDGVKTRDYATILNKWPQKSTTNITVGGQSVPMQKFLQVYEENLNSGAFLSGELGNEGLMKGKTIASGARKVSESREDFGRIVHFYRAMDDEYKALLKTGMAKDKAWDEALNSAIFRVNKFKFDYGALTKFELSVMRRGIPFYTYMRKAIPTLVESLMVNPKYLAAINRVTENAEERYEDTLLPDWMRELGYGKLTDTFGMNFSMLPTNVVDTMFENPVSKTNPIVQSIFEMESGKDSFTDTPLNKEGLASLPEIMANKWRGTNNLRDLAPTVKNAAGVEMPELFFGKRSGLDSDKTTTEKWANFFGFPIKRVAEQEKEQALAEINYKLKGTVEEINATVEEMGYKVYPSSRNDGISLRVRDETTGEVIFEAATLRELREFVKAKRNEGK